MTDRRYWITNPTGHRAFAQELLVHKTGDIIDSPIGPAVFINPSEGWVDSEWICDLCNNLILTAWGAEPFPVPAQGTDAYCDDCRQRIEEGPEYSDRTGEPIPHTKAGPWPPAGCNCPPCQNQTHEWRDQIINAYDLHV